MPAPRILMCPPDYYGIEYEINPWMSRSRGSSPQRAHAQWRGLHDTLIKLGVQVELMTPQPGLPDLVFTANAGLVFGYRIRSDAASHQYLGKVLNRLVLPLELVDPRFYHLDTCFCPVAAGAALYFPNAFDHYGRRVLETHIDKLLPVVEAEAVRFACNAVVVGKTVIVNAGGDRR